MNEQRRNEMIQTVIKIMGITYWNYRFDKASNFVTQDEYVNDKAIDEIIRIGEELKRIKEFKKLTNDQLKENIKKWHDGPNVSMCDDLFYKYKGIDSSYELKRREDEKYFNELYKEA